MKRWIQRSSEVGLGQKSELREHAIEALAGLPGGASGTIQSRPVRKLLNVEKLDERSFEFFAAVVITGWHTGTPAPLRLGSLWDCAHCMLATDFQFSMK